ncbi:MAG: alanine--tRNA ligase-related protein [Clostridiales bacterium]|nr:alanine--tRNA ligase-related protein [Clostridiales bacterium]
MQTTKLYKQDVYLKETLATVTGIKDVKGGFGIILDQTVFFPASGGQPCDTGFIASLESGSTCEILDAYEEDGLVFHVAGECPLAIGDKVKCTINWGRRFENMQRHCGEHILSGIFFSEYGGVNRGFHMGDDYLTIDINLEEKPDIKEITWEMATCAEKRANEIIWSNAPVTTRYFSSSTETSSLPLRKAVAVDEDISIVCVGDTENPADCVACCGTHPNTAGQVGLVKVFKVEHYKGMFRVYFEAGMRALADYGLKNDVITSLNFKYSASTNDLIEKINLRDEKARAVKEELDALKQECIAEKAAEIEEAVKAGDSAKILVREFPAFKTDDLLRLGRPFSGMEGMDKLIMLISPKDNTLLLFSNGKEYNCGKLVKENASIYNGKGGGNASSSRVFFPNREYLDTFIDLIEKHLR